MRRKPIVFILWYPGVNCHLETQYAFEYLGAKVTIVTIYQVMAGKVNLWECDILILAGGFGWGDHIRAGIIAAMDMIYKLASVIQKMLDEGKLIGGICNGYQVIAHSGLLDHDLGNPTILLDCNQSGTYEHFATKVVIHHHDGCPWTQGCDGLEIEAIVAHGEGDLKVLVPPEQCTWKVAATYGSKDGTGDYPISPSGCKIAGLSNGNVFGWFPHVERNLQDVYPVLENAVRAIG